MVRSTGMKNFERNQPVDLSLRRANRTNQASNLNNGVGTRSERFKVEDMLTSRPVDSTTNSQGVSRSHSQVFLNVPGLSNHLHRSNSTVNVTGQLPHNGLINAPQLYGINNPLLSSASTDQYGPPNLLNGITVPNQFISSPACGQFVLPRPSPHQPSSTPPKIAVANPASIDVPRSQFDPLLTSCTNLVRSSSFVRQGSKRHRKARAYFDANITKVLEDFFKETQYISSTQRELLATSLNISEDRIRTWFQNRRMREKRKKTEGHDSDKSFDG